MMAMGLWRPPVDSQIREPLPHAALNGVVDPMGFGEVVFFSSYTVSQYIMLIVMLHVWTSLLNGAFI